MLTLDEVTRIAHLARLSVTDEEKARYARQLSAILEYAAELGDVDLDGIPPTATVIPVRSVTRDGDDAAPGLDRAGLLANAPASDGEHFVVQAAIGEG